jgi:hypothetical protein
VIEYQVPCFDPHTASSHPLIEKQITPKTVRITRARVLDNLGFPQNFKKFNVEV